MWSRARAVGRLLASATLISLSMATAAAPVRAQPSKVATPSSADDPPVGGVSQPTWDRLSGAARTTLQARFATKKAPAAPSAGAEVSPTGPTDRASLVNDPTVDGLADTQSETTLALSGGNVVAAFNDSGSAAAPGFGGHFTGYSVSADRGSTFSDKGVLPDSPDGDGGDMVLGTDASTGRVYLATMEYGNLDDVKVYRSDDGGVTFGPPVSATPGWHSTFTILDKPWLAVDNAAGGQVAGQGNVYVAWRPFPPGAGGGIYFARSTDGGSTWGRDGGTPIKVDDGTQGAYVTVGTDHSVYVFWYESTPSGGAIKFRRSTDQGVTFGPEVVVATLRSTLANGDLNLPYGFRTNSFPQVSVNPVTGQLYAVFNDDPAGDDRADVYLTTSTDNGGTWTTPARVGSDPGTSDQFMPSVGVTSDGTRLLVAFYDRRTDGYWIRRYAVIGDISAGQVRLGTDFPLGPSFPPVVYQDYSVNHTYMGDYDQVVADDQFFYTTWGDNRDPHSSHAHQPDVRFAKIPKNLTHGSADVSVKVADSPDPVPILGSVTHTLVVTNAGPDPAPSVALTATVPPQLGMSSVASTQGGCEGTSTGSVNCWLGTLASGASATVTVQSHAGVLPGPVTVTANVTSALADTNTADNAASATTTIAVLAGRRPPRTAPARSPAPSGVGPRRTSPSMSPRTG